MDLTEKKKSGNDWRFHACLDTTMVLVLSSKEFVVSSGKTAVFSDFNTTPICYCRKKRWNET